MVLGFFLAAASWFCFIDQIYASHSMQEGGHGGQWRGVSGNRKPEDGGRRTGG